MSFRTARVAPEEAVFRPALPLRSLPGMNGTSMGAMTYKEQLLHPNWQRKRLDVLSLANFRCQACGSAEKTLHVHHRRYVKGRMAWDYDASELEALCHECHAGAHGSKERLDRVLAQYPSSMWEELYSLLVGFGEGHVSSAEWLEVDDGTARRGRMAWVFGNFSAEQVLALYDGFMQIGPDRFFQAVRREVNKDFDA